MGKKRTKAAGTGNGANLGFEAKLWLAADKLRSNMDAAEYKHVVLGLIFLKYISDAFEEMHQSSQERLCPSHRQRANQRGLRRDRRRQPGGCRKGKPVPGEPRRERAPF